MHFMNPQRGAHLAQIGPASPPAAAPAAINAPDPNAPTGTAQSGYATPDQGPFECENCTHFQPPGTCNHPAVQSDPEVNGQVEPEGCCTYFASAGNESQDEEHSEGEGETGSIPVGEGGQ